MKVRHVPRVLRDRPGFVLKNAWRMFAHTYRGSSLRSLVGLEAERSAFARYRDLRKAERNYL
jgi:hypothetical protein